MSIRSTMADGPRPGKIKATMDQKLKPFEKGMHEEREGDGDLSRTAKSIT